MKIKTAQRTVRFSLNKKLADLLQEQKYFAKALSEVFKSVPLMVLLIEQFI
jgi:hypothetical protein